MPTILHTLEQSSDDHEALRAMYNIFLEGECYAFAIALSQGLNWPLVGLMKGTVIWHAGVRAPNGRVHDMRGLLTEEEFGSHFLSPPFNIRDISVEELYATRPIDDYSIKRARRLAEVLWPELPWIEIHTTKVRAFADELEALSRKYGFWIHGGVPANPPRLYVGCGDEIGYEVRPTIDGLAHTINRKLP